MAKPHNFTALKTEGPTFSDSALYPAPPATVPVGELGQYLRSRRLAVRRSYWTASDIFIVEVEPISTDIPEEATPNAAL